VKIYVASSWRNEHQPAVVSTLVANGHEVYDFRNPGTENGGFQWEQVDPNWEKWTAGEYRYHLLNNDRCSGAYMADHRAMEWADACVYVLPCGRSASLELGYMIGRGKRTVVLLTSLAGDSAWVSASHSSQQESLGGHRLLGKG